MAHAIRMHEAGGPDVLRWEEVAVGSPGPGQARLRHEAVGLNFADTYFRTGLVSDSAAERHRRRSRRRRRGRRRRRDERRAGRPRNRTPGFVNTLGAYSTERLIPAAPLIKLPGGDLVRDGGRDDDARPDVGVPDAPRLAAYAQATRSCCTRRPAASGSSSRNGRSCSGLTVIGTVSTDAEGRGRARRTAAIT